MGWNSRTYPMRMWGFSLFKILSLGSILYGTKWLFWRPHVQNPALHSKRGVAEGINLKKGKHNIPLRSRCEGRGGLPLTHSFIRNMHGIEEYYIQSSGRKTWGREPLLRKNGRAILNWILEKSYEGMLVGIVRLKLRLRWWAFMNTMKKFRGQ
jgi:hypothetical protein